MKIKTGFGYDVHRLSIGEELWLGGILVPHEKGAVGHSDADVLIHVICDALLGAMNKRDIGYHFPDTDPEFKGVDSKKLLTSVMEMMRQEEWGICNIDSTISLQQPKVSTYIDSMRDCLSGVMGIPIDDISIKATTTEKLGFVGKEEGIAAYAVVLIQKLD